MTQIIIVILINAFFLICFVRNPKDRDLKSGALLVFVINTIMYITFCIVINERNELIKTKERKEMYKPITDTLYRKIK